MGIQIGTTNLPKLEIPTLFCNAPTDLQVAVNDDVVSFSWIKPHEVLYFVLSLFDNNGVFIADYQITGQRHTLKLTEHTTYTWTVRSVCTESNQSELVYGDPFTTGNRTANCPTINLSSIITLLLPDSVQLSWPVITDAIYYEFQYKLKQGLRGYTKLTVQDPKVILQYLLPNREYVYKIRPVCRENTPDFSEDGVFVTPVSETQCPKPIINAVTSANTVILAWQYNTKHIDYDIYIDGIPYARRFVGNLFIIPNLAPKTEYVFDVVANCSGGHSVPATVVITTANLVCNIPANLVAASDGTTLQLSWSAVPGALGYRITNNGTYTEQMGENSTTYNFPLPKNGELYHFQVQTICGTGVTIDGYSLPANISFQDGILCSVVEMVSTTAYSKSIFLDWKDQAGTKKYIVRWKKATDVVFQSVETIISEILIENLSPATSYDLEVIRVCSDDTQVPLSLQLVTAPVAPCAEIINVQVKELTDTSAQLHFELSSGQVNGTFTLFYKKQTDTVFTQIQSAGSPIELQELEPDTVYDYEVVYNCEEGNPYSYLGTFQTLRNCVTPAEMEVIWSTSQNGTVQWTLNFTDILADNYDIYEINQVTGVTQKITTVVGPKNNQIITVLRDTFQQAPVARTSVKIVAIDDQTVGNCEFVIDIPCQAVINLKSEVNGNSVDLSWDPVPGADGYAITLNSQENGTEEFFSDTNAIKITDLRPYTTYSWYVETICGQAGGAFSTAESLTTEDETNEDAGCDKPQFDVFIEDADMSDPTTPANKLIYFGTKFNNTSPTTLSDQYQVTDYTLDSFDVVFGNVPDSVYYFILHRRPDPAQPAKNKWQDNNDVNNAGNIGGITDLFEVRTVTIATETYDLYITRYPTSFNGISKSIKFFYQP